MGRRHFGGNLAGKWILTAGLGGMGGARPLARNHGRRQPAGSGMPPSRIAKRVETAYVDVEGSQLDGALSMLETAKSAASPSQSHCSATSSMYSAHCWAGIIRPDALADQTSAHDPVNGLPAAGLDVGTSGMNGVRAIPKGTARSLLRSMAGMLSTCCGTSAWDCRCSTTATTSGK